jgi:hypothetical protein
MLPDVRGNSVACLVLVLPPRLAKASCSEHAVCTYILIGARMIRLNHSTVQLQNTRKRTMRAQLMVALPFLKRTTLLHLVLIVMSLLPLVQSLLRMWLLPGVCNSFSSSLKQLPRTQGTSVEAAGKGCSRSGSHPELQGRKRSETMHRDCVTQEAPSTTCRAPPQAVSSKQATTDYNQIQPDVARCGCTHTAADPTAGTRLPAASASLMHAASLQIETSCRYRAERGLAIQSACMTN